MSALAIDIGTYSIKTLSGKSGKKVDVARAVEVANPGGLAVPTDDASSEKLAELIDSTLTDHKLPRTDLRLSLPETVVSTKIISIPVLTDAELASAIGWQAEQHIPIPPEQLSLEYQVLFRPERKQKGGQMRVLLVGTRKEIVERFVDMFVMLGVEPRLLETQIFSVIRAIQFQGGDPTTLLVHIGASNMQMAVINQGELQFVTTHLSGGKVFTRALEQGINLDAQQAEQYKRTYGLDETQFEGKVSKVLMPTVEALINEMQKAITFFINQNPKLSVKRLLLSGGSSSLPGLVQLISSKLGLEVLVAAPFSNASGEIPEANHSVWTVCMGLLMREF